MKGRIRSQKAGCTLGKSVCLLLLIVGLGLLGEDSFAAGYQRVMSLAERHDRELQALSIRFHAARKKHKQSKVFPNNPVLSIQGGPILFAPKSQMALSVSLGAQVTLALPVGGRWRRRVLMEQKNVEKLKSQLEMVRLRVRYEAYLRLTSLLFSRKHLEVVKELEDITFKYYRLMRSRARIGATTTFALQMAQLEWLKLKKARLQKEAELRAKRLQMLQVLQLPSTSKLSFSGSLARTFRSLPSIKSLVEKATLRNAKLRWLKKVLVWHRATYLLAQAKGIPDLTMSVSYVLDQGAHYVQGGLSMPLPFFFKNQSAKTELLSKLQQSKIQYVMARNRLSLSVSQAVLRYNTARSLWRLGKRRLLPVVLAQRSTLEKGFEMKAITSLQLIVAQRNWLRHNVQQLRAWQRVVEAELALRMLTGELL